MRSGARAVLTLALLALPLAGCDRGGGGRPPAELATRRETALMQLLAAQRRGELVSEDHSLVLVDQRLVLALVRAALPLDYAAGPQFRVQLDSASVEFDDGLPLVHLAGAVRLASGATSESFARVDLDAELEVLELDPTARVLRCRLKLLNSRLTSMSQDGMTRRLVSDLGRLGLDMLAPGVVEVQIPVRIESEIRLPRVGPGGEVRIQPAVLPLRVTLGQVTAFHGCLWVGLRVDVAPQDSGGGARAVAASPAAPPPARPRGAWDHLRGAARQAARITALRDSLDRSFASDPALRGVEPGDGGVALVIRPEFASHLLRVATERYLQHVELDLGADLAVNESGDLRVNTPLGRTHAGRWHVHLAIRRLTGVLRAASPDLEVLPDGRLLMRVSATVEQGHGAAGLDFRWDPDALTSLVCHGFATHQRIAGDIAPRSYPLATDFHLSAEGGSIVATPEAPREKFPILMDLDDASWARVRRVLAGQDTPSRCGLVMDPDDIVARLRRLAAGGIKIRLPRSIFSPLVLPASLTRTVRSGAHQVEIEVRPRALRVSRGAIEYSAAVTATVAAGAVP